MEGANARITKSKREAAGFGLNERRVGGGTEREAEHRGIRRASHGYGSGKWRKKVVNGYLVSDSNIVVPSTMMKKKKWVGERRDQMKDKCETDQ